MPEADGAPTCLEITRRCGTGPGWQAREPGKPRVREEPNGGRQRDGAQQLFRDALLKAHPGGHAGHDGSKADHRRYGVDQIFVKTGEHRSMGGGARQA